MEKPDIVNRVSTSSLIIFNLEEYYQPGDRTLIDIKDQLFEGLILREKDFRNFIKEKDWSEFKDKNVAITCTSDAIVPTWAYMLIAIALQPFARKIFYGSLQEMESFLYQEKLREVDWNGFRDAMVVVKGCSKVAVPTDAYVEVAARLKAVAKSIMFGEPCSTVPLFKRK